jgi:hypothetical protein
MVLAEELPRLGIAVGRIHDVRADGAAAARIVAGGAPANGYAADRSPAQGQASDGQTADRAEDPHRQATEAEDTERETTDGDRTPCEPAEGQDACGQVPNGDDALGVTPQLAALEIRPHGNIVEGNIPDAPVGALPDAAHGNQAAAPQRGHLLLQLAHPLLELLAALHDGA